MFIPIEELEKKYAYKLGSTLSSEIGWEDYPKVPSRNLTDYWNEFYIWFHNLDNRKDINTIPLLKKAYEEEDNPTSKLRLKRVMFIISGYYRKFHCDNKLLKNYKTMDYDKKKQVLSYILDKLKSTKYKSDATLKGKAKWKKFFEEMSRPFASVLEQWYDKNKQQEMFNPAIHYPIEQEDWFASGYKNKEEYEQTMEADYDDYCSCCGQ